MQQLQTDTYGDRKEWQKIGSVWLHVPSDMKNSIICNDYMAQQQQETLLWNKYQL